MMQGKIAIHAGPPIENALDGWETARSARLNGVVARYLELINAEARALRFTLAEWSYIVDAMSDAAIEGRSGQDWRTGWSMLFSLAEPEARALGLRIEQMTSLAQCAIWEAAAVYWAGYAKVSVADYLAARRIAPVKTEAAA